MSLKNIMPDFEKPAKPVGQKASEAATNLYAQLFRAPWFVRVSVYQPDSQPIQLRVYHHGGKPMDAVALEANGWKEFPVEFIQHQS